MIEISLPRYRRLLALGLLAGVIVLFCSITIAPLVEFVHAQTDQRQLLLKELSKLQGLVAAEPELRALVGKIDAYPMWQRVYHSASAAAAESELQNDFRTLAAAQGIAVDTLQPLDPAGEQDFTRISVRVGFNTTIDHLGQLLAAMEAAPHFMKFENLYVTSPMSQGGGGNAPLVVRGDVQAYLLPDAPR